MNSVKVRVKQLKNLKGVIEKKKIEVERRWWKKRTKNARSICRGVRKCDIFSFQKESVFTPFIKQPKEKSFFKKSVCFPSKQTEHK